ncbi:hypothetical protein SAMN05216189_101969 [Pseudomonas delhiensis]|uniref:Uncharacterized protein n=1 Tax=Pseudomonas delhiensis TaxID=366289 RepID=A0A239I4T7_9PSED|nr:hypothetical protein [Pseudomonas delhiensis]SDJ59076.1 hypothetical protein SAMN05216189_101969 [Pseudomonas delhiensis]SNS88610.1 hypothetical protein SAMN06295949_10950 [Pseudomonas delhiensis]
MADRKLVPLHHQSFDDVLFVNTGAPAAHLYDAAVRRLAALEDLLHVLECHDGDDVLVQETSRLASALVPLAGEARHLYELAQLRLEHGAG